MKTQKNNDYQLTNQFLQKVRFFQNLPETYMRTIFEAAELYDVKQDKFVFLQGDLAERFYVLMDGRVRMTQATADGQQILLRFVEPGGKFGCFSVVEGAVYPGTAQTATDSLIFAWPRQTILPFINTSPQLILNVQRHLLQRIQNLQDDYLYLSTQRVEQRLAQILLRLIVQVGVPTSDGIRLQLTLTRQDIAEMIGSTLHTVSRTLSQWQREGILRSNREEIIIDQPETLQQIWRNI